MQLEWPKRERWHPLVSSRREIVNEKCFLMICQRWQCKFHDQYRGQRGRPFTSNFVTNALVDSIADDSDDLEIRRMLLGPSGAALLRDHEKYSTPAIGSFLMAADPVDAAKYSNQMQIYFAKAMEKFLNDQQRRPPRSGPTSHPNPNLNSNTQPQHPTPTPTPTPTLEPNLLFFPHIA